MGLDMYLTEEVYIGANYKHRNITGVIELLHEGKEITVPFNRVSEIILTAGYWRKANAIHKWFVDNIQDGIDECQRSYVPYEKLIELKALCKLVLETKDYSLLPTEEGYFFGSTDYDEWYEHDLQDTINIIDKLGTDNPFYYQASW